MLVSPEDFERCLEIVRAVGTEPRMGIYGPISLTWRVNREAAVFLGAGRALLLQLAHPWVAAAIADQPHVFADPVGRVHRTFGVMFTMTFGTLDEALAVQSQDRVWYGGSFWQRTTLASNVFGRSSMRLTRRRRSPPDGFPRAVVRPGLLDESAHRTGNFVPSHGDPLRRADPLFL